jgi:hypothetical protein
MFVCFFCVVHLQGVFAYPKQRASVSVGSVLKWRARQKFLRSKACLCLADEQHICNLALHFICKTKSRLRPKALWPGTSFQYRSYWDCSSLFWIPEDTMPSSWRQGDEQDICLWEMAWYNKQTTNFFLDILLLQDFHCYNLYYYSVGVMLVRSAPTTFHIYNVDDFT